MADNKRGRGDRDENQENPNECKSAKAIKLGGGGGTQTCLPPYKLLYIFETLLSYIFFAKVVSLWNLEISPNSFYWLSTNFPYLVHIV